MTEETARPRGLLALVAACMVLSGAAGLVYEVAWARMLGVFLGATAHAHAIVLAGFLGGLALGNAWVGKIVDRRPHQALLMYAVLEAIIGLFGFCSPLIQRAFGAAYFSIAGDADPTAGLVVLKLMVAAGFVLLPTVAMGGTIPALTRFLVADIKAVGRAVSRLYLVNTVGAAVGCFAAGVVLIPAYGVVATVMIAAATNLLIALVTALAHARHRVTMDDADAQPDEDGPPIRAPRNILAAVFIMGIATLTLEVSWTRIFATVFGSSAQAFTLMLTAFIAGIAGGSAFAPSMLSRFGGREAVLLGRLLALSACILALQMPLYEHLPYWQFEIAHALERRPHVYPLYVGAQALLAFAWMMPLTLVTGAVLPVAAHVYTQRVDDAGTSVGRLFASNTCGNVIGPILVTFLLFPLVGVQRAISIGVVGLCIAAIVVVPPEKRTRTLLLTCAAASLGGILWPQWEPSVMQAGGFRRWTLPHDATFAEFRDSRMNSRPLFIDDNAVDSVVVLENRDGQRFMKVNGKTDASDAEDLPTQRMVAHVPLLLHHAWTGHETRDVYVVGLGSGVTVGSAAMHPGTEVTAVEISPGVIEGSRFFDRVNRDVHNLDNVTIHEGDAREFLERSGGGWDVVINQPSNPWIAGNAALFSREFYLAAREGLADDGVFAQWMHVYAMDDETVRIVMNTFASVFPHVTLWWPQGVDLLLIGSNTPLEPDFGRLEAGLAEESLRAEMRTYPRQGIRISSLDRFLALQVMSDEGFRSEFDGSPPYTSDLHPTLEFRAPVAQFVGARAELFVEMDERLRPGESTQLYWGELGRPLALRDLTEFFLERDTPFSEQIAGSLLHATASRPLTASDHRALATGGTGLAVLLESWIDALLHSKPTLAECSELLSTAKTILPIRATAFYRPDLSTYRSVVAHCRQGHSDAAAFLRAMEAEIYFAVGRYEGAEQRARQVLSISGDPTVVEAMNRLLPEE